MWESLIGGGVTAIAALVGVFVSHRMHRKSIEFQIKKMAADFDLRKIEQELSVSRVILPQCVNALQELFGKVHRMNVILSNASYAQSSDETTEAVEIRKEASAELRKIIAWYFDNCVYIGANLRTKMLKTVKFGQEHLRQLSVEHKGQPVTGDVWDKLGDLFDELGKTVEDFMKKYNLVERSMETQTEAGV